MYFVLEKLKELEEIIVGITKNPITITSDISIDDIRDAFKERHKDQEDEKPRIPKKMLDDQTMLFKDQERDERDERPAVVKELEKSESEMSAAELLKRMSGE
jgi:CBS domain-containing protein